MYDAAQLLDALRSPSAYDHPVGQVEVIETHISWVLLAGEFAYKIKKPVRLPFCDFSTLERRRFFCQEELRLNRRLAERIYVAVAPIAGPLASPRVNGRGEPVEYAVQMRRFPQESVLSRVLDEGRLTPAHLDQWARVTAEFHSRAAVAPPDSPWGSWPNVQQPIDENFQELLGATPAGGELFRRLEDLRRWSMDRLNQLREPLAARKRQGFIRECHGDMHLGNVVLLPREEAASGPREEVVLFDGIDFNENFRWIDVQNEIAFAVMDLDQRGRADLAWRFLNAYLERTGDYEGLTVLPLYLNYRAVVRAKVDWIRGRQAGVDESERQRLEQEFARYLSLAERYARPPHPRLFLTHGVSGSGKSHLAGRLAEAFGAVRIRSDAERKRLLGGDAPREGGEHRPPVEPSALYSPEATAETHARLARLAAAALEAGFSVIIDATLLARTRRAPFLHLARRLNVPCHLLDLRASPETLRQRILSRREEGVDPSDADLTVLARQQLDREPLTDEERALAIEIDTEAPDALERVLATLGTT